MRHEDTSKEQPLHESVEFRRQIAELEATKTLYSQAEERKSALHFRNILDSLFILAGLLTPDGTLIEVNKIALALAGLKPEDVLGKPFEETYWWSYSEPVKKRLRKAIKRASKGETSRYDVAIRVAENRFITIDFSLQPLTDQTGRVIYLVPSATDITERKQAEEAVQEAREYAESIVETVREPLVALDADLRVISANRSFYQTFKALPEETEGRFIYELGNRQWDIPNFRQLLEEILPQNTSFDNFEVEHNFPRIGRRVMLLNARRLLRKPGKAGMILLAIEDITERKRAEEALKVSHHFLKIVNRHTKMTPLLKEFVAEVKKFTGCAAVGIRILDKDGNIPYQAYEGFSQKFYESENHLSIKEDQCLCINVIKGVTDPKLLSHTEGGSFYINDTTRLLATVSEENKGHTCNLCNQFGYESVALVPVRAGDRMLGLIHVTDPKENMVPLTMVKQLEEVGMQLGMAIKRLQAEEAMREREERYRFLYEESPAINTIIGMDGTIKDVNKSFITKLGYSKDEIIGKHALEFIVPEQRGKGAAQLKRYFKGEHTPEIDIDVYAKDDSIHTILFSSGKVILHDNNQPTNILITGIDITERKHAKEEKKKIQAQLLQAQKMEAIGKLAGGVAHDFNNLLTTIHGYTELAMMRLNEADPLYRDLREIHLSATRAASLTRQLLLFSRKQPMEFVPININRTVDDLLKMLRRLIGEDIDINIDLEPALWTIRADAVNIEQVIMNLAVNARDAMPEGGKLTIRTKNLTLDEEFCKLIPDARPGKFVCLLVEDTGVGMDKEITQHIFEPFFSTKEAGRGTGLGLSVVYGIVKQHGGWINVYSEPGQGSTFKVYLPAFPAKLEEKTKKTISLQEFQGNGEWILLVEDEEKVRELTKRALCENGYVVFEAANAREAMDIFEREGGKFHLVFSDVVLPDKTGLQLVHQLLSRKPELHVLLSSGYTDDKSQWSTISKRGFRFLQKPYTLPDLLQAIKEAIERN